MLHLRLCSGCRRLRRLHRRQCGRRQQQGSRPHALWKRWSRHSGVCVSGCLAVHSPSVSPEIMVSWGATQTHTHTHNASIHLCVSIYLSRSFQSTLAESHHDRQELTQRVIALTERLHTLAQQANHDADTCRFLEQQVCMHKRVCLYDVIYT